jgi:uncharacterized protein
MFDLDVLVRYPQYVQLVGVGFVWISLHCAGMCGPIVLGLDLGNSLGYEHWASLTRRQRFSHSAKHITAYQLGRSITYAVIGALAGLAGSALQELFTEVAKITGIFVAVALLGFGVLRLLGSARIDSVFTSDALGKLLGRLARRARQFSGLRQKLLLGVILGFLPCMITFWALSLAASTQSALHGAVLMVLLVWMTSVVIYGFGFAPALTSGHATAWRERLLSLFLIFSGVWLGMVSAAANEWIPHAMYGFEIGGRGFAIMFW